jgi:hypothetical protein
MWKTEDHNVSETGSVSVLMWFVLSHPPEDGDRSSFRNVVVFCLPHTRRWIKSVISPIALYKMNMSLSDCDVYYYYII